jgi:phosphatidylglycerol:prolipoprotein diacylglycerol transferase
MFPKLLELGPVTLHTYGVLLVSAYLAALALTAKLAERDGIPKVRTWDVGFVILVSALIGAKLLMVVSDLGAYWRDPGQLVSLEFWRAAGVYYGGFLGAVAGTAWYLRRVLRVPFLRFADAAAPAVALGQGIGRLGCFAAGCDYGNPFNGPWAVVFTSDYAAMRVGVPLHQPLHPAQLYESFAAFALFGVLWALHRRRSFEGQAFAVYLAAYGALRFFLEFYRGDLDRGFVAGWLSTSQLISLLIAPAGLLLYLVARARRAEEQRA